MNIEGLNELRVNSSEEFKKANPSVFPEYSKPTTGLMQAAGKDGEQYPSMTKRAIVKRKASDNVSGITEAELQKEVIAFLHEQGYKVLVTGAARVGHGEKERYVTPYRADGKGFPDVFAVKSGRALAFELKSDVGTASPEQVEWLLALSLCGALTGIVTPSTWEKTKEKIQEVV